MFIIRDNVLTPHLRDARRTDDRETYFLADRRKNLNQTPNQETYIIRTSPPGRADVTTKRRDGYRTRPLHRASSHINISATRALLNSPLYICMHV